MTTYDALPRCPHPLPASLSGRLVELAREWAASVERPKPIPAVLEAWDHLLATWIERAELPLLIRKPAEGRGAVRHHKTGRKVVPTDNTPARWSFAMALRGQCPTVEEVAAAFVEDKIPIAMVLKREERRLAVYRSVRGHIAHLNAAGWKLAHVVAVALGGRVPLEGRPIGELKQHFLRFISPRNMFLVPLVWAGLAETEEMTFAIRGWHDAGGGAGQAP